MIKAVLMDSGRVLNEPLTGSWFIPPDFFKWVDKKSFYNISASKKTKAFRKAGEYIKKQNLILDEEEEYRHFFNYYSIFFNELYELQLSSCEVDEIAKALVFNYDKYKFYEDGLQLIPKLSENYKLAVVSDAWPSLEGVFKKAELRKYFSSFVISSIEGVTKPNELMYKTALEELAVSPSEAVFVDDNPRNCEVALKLGIEPFLLCRDVKVYIYSKVMFRKYKVISNLWSLDKILKLT